MLILRLNKAGLPLGWLNPELAARLYCQNKVLYELGRYQRMLHGGRNVAGLQSTVTISTIIGCTGKTIDSSGKVTLTNRYLFRRDNCLCLYCGRKFPLSKLTKDHVFPRSRGGKDLWQNVATACQRCNRIKGARTPEEANMPLLAVPFKPNVYEQLFLMNRRILADQMDFSSHHFSHHRHWA